MTKNIIKKDNFCLTDLTFLTRKYLKTGSLLTCYGRKK